jgi:hypothetical protein
VDEIDKAKAIKEYGGILPPHHAFYAEAIRFNIDSAHASARYVLLAFDELDTAGWDFRKTQVTKNQILDQIQNILVHAAALSRFFWPPYAGEHKIHKIRAATLRSTFKIKNDSALKNRDLRNHLEHFDENLDVYLWSKSIAGFILPAYVGEMPTNEQVPHHLFRAYYIDTGIFETLGRRFKVDPILEEVGKLHAHFYNEART